MKAKRAKRPKAQLTPENSAAGLSAALDLASQPNYLGSPEVVHQLLQQLLSVTIEYHADRVPYAEYDKSVDAVALAFSKDDSGYTKMPGWHTEQGLGKLVIVCFNLDPQYFEGDNLGYILQEGFAFVGTKIRELLKGYQADPKAQWDPDALRQLNDLHQFLTSVMLGTNELHFRGRTLKDFSWKPVVA